MTKVREKSLQSLLNDLNFLLQAEGYNSKGAMMSFVLFCSYVVQYGDSVLYVAYNKKKRKTYRQMHEKLYRSPKGGKIGSFISGHYIQYMSFIIKTSSFTVSCYEHFTQIFTSHYLLLFAALR